MWSMCRRWGTRHRGFTREAVTEPAQLMLLNQSMRLKYPLLRSALALTALSTPFLEPGVTGTCSYNAAVAPGVETIHQRYGCQGDLCVVSGRGESGWGHNGRRDSPQPVRNLRRHLQHRRNAECVRFDRCRLRSPSWGRRTGCGARHSNVRHIQRCAAGWHHGAVCDPQRRQ
jgi:hypothetical protein